ncbi:MAG: hypothetical protein ACNA8K_17565, partial [Cyclonatronaceae bacterium]
MEEINFKQSGLRLYDQDSAGLISLCKSENSKIDLLDEDHCIIEFTYMLSDSGNPDAGYLLYTEYLLQSLHDI